MVTETLTVYRGGNDKMGNTNRTTHGTVQGVFAWGNTAADKPPGGRGEASSTDATLYVPKGADLKARDRVKRANGNEYRVVGGAQWDQNHPNTNRDFGWLVFTLQSL